MTVNDILMLLDKNTKVRLVVTMHGVKFSSENYPEYYLHYEGLLDKEVLRALKINIQIPDAWTVVYDVSKEE